MDDVTLRKLARNEALFREVNDQIHAVRQGWGAQTTRYVCECADADCVETIALDRDTYHEIRSSEQRFFLVPGHEIPALEVVIERHPTFSVVEKRVAVPRL